MPNKFTFALLFVSSLVFVACGPGEPPPAPPPPAVEVETVALSPVTTSFEFVARTRAREDTEIRAQVTGTIIERNFNEGQAVEENALLFRIDPRPYEAALQSARADLSSAQSAMVVAQNNYERAVELLPNGFVSQAEVDRLAGDYDGARAAVGVAEAAVEKAQLDLGFTEVRAPFAGTAGRANLSIGDLVDPSAGPLVSLVKLDPMLADFDVNEQTMAQRMANNQERQAQGLEPFTLTPQLKLVTGDIYAHAGTIDYANNRVNPSTGTITVTASFPNPDGSLLPGQFARILIQRGEAEDRLLIAQSSVLEDMQGRYVFVVDDDHTVKRRNVTLGRREGTRWVVDEGLEEGQRVIVNGIQKVSPGMTVTATPVSQADPD